MTVDEAPQPSRFEVILKRAEAAAAFGWKALRVVWVCVQLALLLTIVVLLVWVAHLVIELVGMIRAIPEAVWGMMPSMDGFWPFGDEKPAPVEDEKTPPTAPDERENGDERLWPRLKQLLP